MIAGCVTKDFGVLASDSALYIDGKTSFESPKMISIGKYLCTFVGHIEYFAKVDRSKFDMGIASLAIYLQDYFKSMTGIVEESLRALNRDPDDQIPRMCAMILGIYNGRPTLAQVNSFSDFKPKYLYSDGEPAFSTILYGDDNADKQKVFKDSTSFMERKLSEWKSLGIEITPGIIGEILTRGIHKKSDLEMKIKPFKKYAGGPISVAKITSEGKAIPMTATIF